MNQQNKFSPIPNKEMVLTHKKDISEKRKRLKVSHVKVFQTSLNKRI